MQVVVGCFLLVTSHLDFDAAEKQCHVFDSHVHITELETQQILKEDSCQ